MQAMDIVKDVVHNEHIKLALEAARKNIKEGESIATPFIPIKSVSPGGYTNDKGWRKIRTTGISFKSSQ